MTGPQHDRATGTAESLPDLGALAVVQARAGELPPGALEAMTEAGGSVLVVGDGAAAAAQAAVAAVAAGTAGTSGTAGAAGATGATGAAGATGTVWWCDTGPGLQPGRLAGRLGPVVAGIPLLVLPGTPDGRDLAPRLAAWLGRPLLANACRAVLAGTGVRAQLCRLDDRITIPAEVDGPAVVTLAPGTGTISAPGAGAGAPRAGAGPTGAPGAGAGAPGAPGGPVSVSPVALPDSTRPVPPGAVPPGTVPPGTVPPGTVPPGTVPPGTVPPGTALDVTVIEVLEPDPSTMEVAEAPLVFSGGAGLAAGLDLPAARAAFGLLAAVAAALGASAGATRVATDAGWTGHDRQIGTTGVMISPRLYVAFGVSGAAQHTGGLGAPEHIVSVNLDAYCPMTAMSSLGIVADARATLVELADRLAVPVPAEVRMPGEVRDAR